MQTLNIDRLPEEWDKIYECLCTFPNLLIDRRGGGDDGAGSIPVEYSFISGQPE